MKLFSQLIFNQKICSGKQLEGKHKHALVSRIIIEFIIFSFNYLHVDKNVFAWNKTWWVNSYQIRKDSFCMHSTISILLGWNIISALFLLKVVKRCNTHVHLRISERIEGLLWVDSPEVFSFQSHIKIFYVLNCSLKANTQLTKTHLLLNEYEGFSNIKYLYVWRCIKFQIM